MAQQQMIQRIRHNPRKAVFVFDHGLGDFIHYIPVHLELERQAQCEVALAASRSRQFPQLWSRVIDAEDIQPRLYSFVYKVQYPDTKSFQLPFEVYDEPSKPYLCAYYEYGMNFFVWTPHIIKRTGVAQKRIGVHFFGHTGAHHKFCPPETAEQIWKEIEMAGYEPYECHMRPDFRSRYRDCGVDEACFIPDKQTIRYQKPGLDVLRDVISTCDYFIGVDSGPLYLASSILGHHNVIGLENQKRVAYYCPKHINTISIREYQPGTVFERIKRMEGRT